jgi:hypothetical protein
VTSSRRLGPDGVDGNPERGGPDRAPLARDGGARISVAGAVATFFILLLVAEGSARWAAGSGWIYRRLDFSGSLTSLPELEQRIAWNARRSDPIFLLGDSVLGATALWEHRFEHPRRLTIPAQLAPSAAAGGMSVQSLGADGLLLPDLEAIDRAIDAVQPHAPARRLIVLNVRMFAAEFASSGKALSREFLLPELESAGAPPDPALARRDDALGGSLSAGAARHSVLARTAWQLQPLWYFPTRRDAFRRLLEPAHGGAAEGDADLQEAALHLKVDPYYRDRWDPSSVAFRALGALLEAARRRGDVQTIVVLTPQNPEFVGDTATFASNRRVLSEFVARHSQPGGASVAYRDLGEQFPSDRFLDHCHLTPDGNREYAQILLALLNS